MKDGVYKVIVTIDGVETEVTGTVKDGYFEGSGIVSGLKGCFVKQGRGDMSSIAPDDVVQEDEPDTRFRPH